MERMTKRFATFDCDAHINDPLRIWEYVPERERELVRAAYWRDDSQAWLNGHIPVGGGGTGEYAPTGMYNPICLAGPQMDIRIIRRLLTMVPLTDEQREYLEHQGATDPHARVHDLDLMGIDQVLVIPTKVIEHLPFIEDPRGADAFCRAYNSFVADWCAAVPERLFPAALLPLQDPDLARRELERVAGLGFRVALVRPIDAQGQYPNDIGAPAGTFRPGARSTGLDPLFRAFEATGIVLGMHTFPAARPHRVAGPGKVASPGELMLHAGVDSQTLSFVYEAQTWLAQVLLAGFLDRYPRLKMAVFESNSQWLPGLLEHCDRLFRCYRNERRTRADRLPSEAFDAQCVISFEGDEEPTIRRWRRFENIGIWSSDAYHHDAADAWRAIATMQEVGVPEAVQAKLMGANACRAYGIEPRLFVDAEPPRIERPAWFPQGPEFEAWCEDVGHPRRDEHAAAPPGHDAVGAAAR
jgi:predicted TIM-barrel fold metal-dependent hydrolase